MPEEQEKKKSNWLLWFALALFVGLAFLIANSYTAKADDVPPLPLPDTQTIDVGLMQQMYESKDGYTLILDDMVLTAVEPGLIIEKSKPLYLMITYYEFGRTVRTKRHICQSHFGGEDCVEIGDSKEFVKSEV